MAKVIANPTAGLIQGKVGGLLYSRSHDGQVIVRRAPVRLAPPTEPELANRERFRRATAFVRGWREQPELAAIYKQAGRERSKRACDLGLADFLRPPRIQSIDLSRDTGNAARSIRIEVIDVIRVREVNVTIVDLAGAVLESGAAVPDSTSESAWAYSSQLDLEPNRMVVISVTATDWAGNQVTARVDHILR